MNVFVVKRNHKTVCPGWQYNPDGHDSIMNVFRELHDAQQFIEDVIKDILKETILIERTSNATCYDSIKYCYPGLEFNVFTSTYSIEAHTLL